MKKDRILKKVVADLDNNGYSLVAIKNMHTCVDILARKLGSSLAIKVAYNIDATNKKEAESLHKLASFFGAEPLIVGAVSKDKPLEQSVVYSRFSTKCMSETSIGDVGEQRITYVASKTVGVKVNIAGEKLRYLMKLNNTTAGRLARKVGISKAAVYKYENDENYASLKTARKIEKVLNGQIVESERQYPNKRSNSRLTMLAKTKIEMLKLSNAPFDAAAKGSNYYEISYDANARTMTKRAELFSELVNTFDGNYPFFVSSSRKRKINGIPVISKDLFNSISSEDELLSFITN